MKLPVDIRFLGMEASPAVESVVRERVARIERQCPGLVGWRVAVEQPHRHHLQGRSFSVRVEVTFAGGELAVDRVEDEDVHVALRDAFDAIRRRIEDAMRIRRGQVKTHEPAAPPAAEE